MRILKMMSVLLGIQIMAISGCGGGGGGSTPPPTISASLSTTISNNQATSKLNVSGLSANICGFDAILNFPAGATFNVNDPNAVTTPVSGLIAANPLGNNTLKLALAASAPGFSSGEVATIIFGITGNVLPTDFSIASFTPLNCP